MKLKTIAIIAALALPMSALADDKTTSTTEKTKTTEKTRLADTDLQVLAHVHHVNQMEIDLGKMAERQGGTQAVKAYGQMLVRDHQSADKDLTAFAKKNDVTIPLDKPKDEAEQKEQKDTKEEVMHLKTLKGNDFDTAFLQMMVEGHEKELAKLDANIGSIQNQDLATILKDIKPVLQKHADLARDLQKNNAQAMK